MIPRIWESYLDVTVENLRGILSYEMNGKSWGDQPKIESHCRSYKTVQIPVLESFPVCPFNMQRRKYTRPQMSYCAQSLST